MRLMLGASLLLMSFAACGGSNGSGGDAGIADAAVVDAAVDACVAAQVCGAVCCGDGQTCLFEQCVTPGADCRTTYDCPDGQYCETGIASGGVDGGVAPDGGSCTQPLPVSGKCVAVPANVPECEYRLTAGPLDAVTRWTWGPVAQTDPDFTDVWSTPAVGRVVDANCDGRIDLLDPPDVVFVSGRAKDATTGVGTCCHCTNGANSACKSGVLRMLDGRSGRELWSLRKASAASIGFSGVSVAIADFQGDGTVEVAAVTGEGFIVMLDSQGNVLATSNLPIPGSGHGTFGWGGGLGIADFDGDGAPEIYYGATVFNTGAGTITLKFTGAGGIGGGQVYEALSTAADLDGAAGNQLELLAGRTAYRYDGTPLWNRTDLGDGFSAVADLDRDGDPEAVLVSSDTLYVLDAATGATVLGPFALPGNGFGGPPTLADFDGDSYPEIGVAQQNFYSVIKPYFQNPRLAALWSTPNHDLSSSVTGSSVFDFEGDGRAEVIYGDECFFWVFDGRTGAVRFSAPTTSFTGTEASIVVDIDGDGRAELLMVSNGADPSSAGWGCMNAAGAPVTVNGVTWTPSTLPSKAYRGITVFGDRTNSWVGTRSLWNQHSYHVTNICDDTDSACPAPNKYASIPRVEQRNWVLPWLDNFRQNVQERGLFDAPDAAVTLTVECLSPLVAHANVRNLGRAALPAGVNVGIFKLDFAGEVPAGMGTTTRTLLPGQTERVDITLTAGAATDSFLARIVPSVPATFHQCRDMNDASQPARAVCLQ